MSDYLYTPLFCEENIWQLASRFIDEGCDAGTLQVLLISNRDRQVVLFNQRQGVAQGYVVWDYHVVLRCRDEQGDRIYDFDSLLPFPAASRDYFAATFGEQQGLPPSLRAILRLIPATAYRQHFYSDRSHMQGVIDEAEYPPWPAILPVASEAIPLTSYWDVQQSLADDSRLMDVQSFIVKEL